MRRNEAAKRETPQASQTKHPECLGTPPVYITLSVMFFRHFEHTGVDDITLRVTYYGKIILSRVPSFNSGTCVNLGIVVIKMGLYNRISVKV